MIHNSALSLWGKRWYFSWPKWLSNENTGNSWINNISIFFKKLNNGKNQ